MSNKKNKKENPNVYDVNNGITITDSISLTINSKYWINAKLLLIIIALVGNIGFTFSFLSLFNFSCDTTLIYGVQAASFLIFSIINLFPSKSKILSLPIFIILGYMAFEFRTSLYVGYREFINTIALKLHFIRPGQEYVYPNKNFAPYNCLTIFLAFLFIVITFIICYNTIVKPRFVLVFSSTFPFIEAGLYFGYAPDTLPFFILIAYWIALFSMRIAGNQFHSTSGQPVFVRKRNIFVSSGNLKNNVIESIGIITLVAVFLIFILSSAVVHLFSYERSEKVNNVRSEMKTAISEMSFEKIINSFKDTQLNSPLTSRSRLGNLTEITFKDRTELTVVIAHPSKTPIYLKGFVGAKYSNNTWYSISDEAISNNENLFDLFNEYRFFPQAFAYFGHSVISDESFYKNKINIISKFNKNEYLFTPYGVKTDENMYANDDSYLKAENMSQYNCDFMMTPNELYKDMDSVYEAINTMKTDSTFEKIERNYREFVYENYLTLPDLEQIHYLNEHLSPQIPIYTGLNADDIYESIKNILTSSAEYSLSPGKTPDGTDLAYYMLMENHKGYCSHFATAAIVLARLAGLPARYVEGYVIVPSDFDTENKTTGFRINVKDSRAHAWAEFYIDGFGWVPFEFTPGYDVGTISAEKHLKDSAQTTIVSTITKTEAVTEQSVSETILPEATTTTVPTTTNVSSSVTSVVTSAVTGDTTTTPTQKETSLSPTVKFILGLIMFIMLSVLVIITRHILIIRKRMSGFRNKSYNKAISDVYKYVIQLLHHYGISNNNMMPLEFAEYAEENAEGLCESGKITEFIKLTLKSNFSNEEISKDEVEFAISLSKKIATNIYYSKNKYQKLLFRYIFNLIQ